MRDIKFKARKRKRFNAGTTYGSTVYEWITYFPSDGLPELAENENWIYGQVEIQFTGLLDKNGKEIYEGDSLIWHNETDEPDENIEPVIFDDGAFRCGSDLLCDLDLDAMEITGNIYENPELLKES